MERKPKKALKRTPYGASNLILDTIETLGMTQKELAEILGILLPALNRKLKTGTFIEDEMPQIMKKVGEATGREIKYIAYCEGPDGTRIMAETARELLNQMLKKEDICNSKLARMHNKNKTSTDYVLRVKTHHKREEIQNYAESVGYNYIAYVTIDGKIVGNEFLNATQNFAAEHFQTDFQANTALEENSNKQVICDLVSANGEIAIRCKEMPINEVNETAIMYEVNKEIKGLLRLPCNMKKILVFKKPATEDAQESVARKNVAYFESFPHAIEVWEYDMQGKIMSFIYPYTQI